MNELLNLPKALKDNGLTSDGRVINSAEKNPRSVRAKLPDAVLEELTRAGWLTAHVTYYTGGDDELDAIAEDDGTYWTQNGEQLGGDDLHFHWITTKQVNGTIDYHEVKLKHLKARRGEIEAEIEEVQDWIKGAKS